MAQLGAVCAAWGVHSTVVMTCGTLCAGRISKRIKLLASFFSGPSMFVLRSPGGYFRSNKPVNKNIHEEAMNSRLPRCVVWAQAHPKMEHHCFQPQRTNNKRAQPATLGDSWYHRNRLTRSSFFSVRSKDPWRNRDYALARVSSDGDYLHRAPDDLLRDRELVLRAICSSEGDLRSAKSFFCEVGLCFQWFQKFNGTGTPFDVFDRWGST